MKRTLPRWMLAAALLTMALSGCSSSTGTVSGKVAFQGKPVPAGTVTFIHADGPTRSGSIHEGSYSVAQIPPGPCLILIVSLPPPRSMWSPEKRERAAGNSVSSKFQAPMPLPARYGDPQKSDLRYEVTTGRQTHDIELKP